MRLSLLVALLFQVVPLVAASASITETKVTTTTAYAFATEEDANASLHNEKKLRRHRRRTKENVDVQQLAKEAKEAGSLTQEDKIFWDRLLADELSIATPAPTPKPVTAPTPATAAPTPCPVIIEVDCVSVDGSSACTDIEPPASGSGADCLVEVEYSYTFTNVGTEVERIYALEITRGGVTTDITDTFPITDIAPGQQAFVLESVVVDVCSGDASIFDTEAAFVTGPPCDVEVTIACESEEGDECRSLPQAASPDECLLDITYTYTVTNIGNVDANIILFTRTRNGEFRDLIGLLPDTYLEVGDDTAVQETEEIDRCIQQSFATNTIVAQIPNADLLCEDVGFYP